MLSLDDKIEAAYMVFIDKERQCTVARHFRVTASAISSLVQKVLSNNTKILSELNDRKKDKLAVRKRISDYIYELVEREEIIDSAKTVSQQIQQQTG